LAAADIVDAVDCLYCVSREFWCCFLVDLIPLKKELVGKVIKISALNRIFNSQLLHNTMNIINPYFQQPESHL